MTLPPEGPSEGEYVSELRAMAKAQDIRCRCGKPYYHDEPCDEEAEREVNRAMDRHIGAWMRGVEVFPQ